MKAPEPQPSAAPAHANSGPGRPAEQNVLSPNELLAGLPLERLRRAHGSVLQRAAHNPEWYARAVAEGRVREFATADEAAEALLVTQSPSRRVLLLREHASSCDYGPVRPLLATKDVSLAQLLHVALHLQPDLLVVEYPAAPDAELADLIASVAQTGHTVYVVPHPNPNSIL